MNEAISKERLSSKDLYLNKFNNKIKKGKVEPTLRDDKLVMLRNAVKGINYTDISFQEGELYGNEQFYNVEIITTNNFVIKSN